VSDEIQHDLTVNAPISSPFSASDSYKHKHLAIVVGVGDGGGGGHVPPKFRKIFFRQLSCKIQAFYWVKMSCPTVH